MRTPESFSFGSVLRKALDPQGPSIEKAKAKSEAQEDVARLSRMRNQITDTIEEFNRHLNEGSMVDAIEEARFTATDLTTAAKRLEKLPLEAGDSITALKSCAHAIGLLVDTVDHLMGPKKVVDKGNGDYITEQVCNLQSLFNVAYQAFDEVVARADQEIGR